MTACEACEEPTLSGGQLYLSAPYGPRGNIFERGTLLAIRWGLAEATCLSYILYLLANKPIHVGNSMPFAKSTEFQRYPNSGSNTNSTTVTQFTGKPQSPHGKHQLDFRIWLL